MSKRKFLSVLAVSAAATAVLGGVPAAASAATAGAARAANDPAFGSLSPTLAAQLSRNVDRPVIVVLKNQFGQAAPGTPAASARSAAVVGSQAALLTELSAVHATGIKRFTLVNSVAATVSAAEQQRLAANAAVAQVIPDATVSIPASALGLPAPAATPTTPAATTVHHITPGAPAPARTTSLPLHTIAGACAPKGQSYLAPEGLALTSTASASSNAATARSLGFTGAGVKVAFIADGVDPNNVNFIARNGKSVFADYQDFTGDGRARRPTAARRSSTRTPSPARARMSTTSTASPSRATRTAATSGSRASPPARRWWALTFSPVTPATPTSPPTRRSPRALTTRSSTTT